MFIKINSEIKPNQIGIDLVLCACNGLLEVVVLSGCYTTARTAMLKINTTSTQDSVCM